MKKYFTNINLVLHFKSIGLATNLFILIKLSKFITNLYNSHLFISLTYVFFPFYFSFIQAMQVKVQVKVHDVSLF